jgi:hypothetical protein
LANAAEGFYALAVSLFYGPFRRFLRRFLFETIHDVALKIDRGARGVRRARVQMPSTANR